MTHIQSEIQPFTIAIPQAKLDDLHERLLRINWPHDFANDDWRYGANAAYLREFVDTWLHGYDWREQEAKMNALDHYRTVIEGIPVHFIHQKGVGPDPTPVILTHGWPWTFWDFHKVIGPLSDPGAFGGDPEDACDVIVPSLPGFGFSTPLTQPGVHWGRTADLWLTLMRDKLGYQRFVAHGGDWGALVTGQLGHKYPEHVAGVHMSSAFPLPGLEPTRPWSISALAIQAEPLLENNTAKQAMLDWEKRFSAHLAAQTLGPQTLSYSMHDSPLGMAAWLLERRRVWGDCREGFEARFSREELLNNVMIYWLTDSFVTSVRFYHEVAHYRWEPEQEALPIVSVPTALSLFEYDLPPTPLDWTSTFFNLKAQNVYARGGHFGAAEEPEKIVHDIRAHIRAIRSYRA